MDEVNMEWLETTSQQQSVSYKSSGISFIYKERPDEISNNETYHPAFQVSLERPVCVKLQYVSANWNKGQLPPTLCNITTMIKPGTFCALVGAVGSGKSSMLYLLLRELNPGAGNVIFTQDLSQNGAKIKFNKGYITDNPNLHISYVSQEAWLFVGTVRDNILFGQPYDKARYAQVLVQVHVAIWYIIRKSV